jgi:uncharacterized membrane protein
MTPEAVVHASAGAIGMLFGATALLAVKGSRLHRRAGAVFFVAMSTTAASGAYLGVVTKELGNVVAGVLTLYVMITAWMTVRRPEGQVGWFECPSSDNLRQRGRFPDEGFCSSGVGV